MYINLLLVTKLDPGKSKLVTEQSNNSMECYQDLQQLVAKVTQIGNQNTRYWQTNQCLL
jgi:hypothetical protein